MAAGCYRGGSLLFGHVLRIIKNHGPTGAVATPGKAVPVHLLPRTAGRIEVAVTAGVRVVIRPQDTGERPAHSGMVQNALELGHSGQNIVAWIALLLEYGFGLPKDGLVHVVGEIRLDNHVAINDKIPHAGIVQQNGLCGHGGSFGEGAVTGSLEPF